MEDLGHFRKSYEKSRLVEAEIPSEPMALFNRWFQEARESGSVDEANAMTVSTSGIDGFPKSRVVLLKQYTDEGFVFYTNYNSEKGRAISQNPRLCLSFFWPSLERQVIIKGIAEKTPQEVSDAYFQSRPHGSKLGALVSNQSEVLPSREFLELQLQALEAGYAEKPIPRPEYWGGYLVKPVEIEFWQGRPNRLHDRIRFKSSGELWQQDRLSP
ncbi:MAG TPA: pyridoxamine 5'-phosphate oxidase [Flavobacterium sp.]|jgi:pyridoxamine 5'-phosphate oxidase